MTSIRTPDDENPDWFYAPFTEGWYYEGQTYAGHTDASVDFNRRTKSGGWVQDEGDPVLAAQDGEVAEVDKAEGLVMLNHHGGLSRTEYRHMTNIPVKVGEKVKRGDRVGRIGMVGSNVRITSPHLHHVHWKRGKTSEPFRRTRMVIEGKPLEVSVPDSDTRPGSWKPPTPVLLQGPPPKATWESAYKESERLRSKAEERVDGLGLQLRAAADELKAVKADLAAEKAKVATYEVRVSGYIEERTFLSDALKKATAERDAARAELETCMARPTDAALAAERDGALERARQEMERANAEADRAVEAETKVREAVAVLTR